MRDESCKSWNSLHSILPNLIHRLYWRERTNIYDNRFIDYRKTAITIYMQNFIAEGGKKIQDCISKFLLITPALAKFHTFERQHSSKCFPDHIIPGNFEIFEILKVRIYQNNLRWLLLVSIKDRSNNFLFILAIERVR